LLHLPKELAWWIVDSRRSYSRPAFASRTLMFPRGYEEPIAVFSFCEDADHKLVVSPEACQQ